MQSVFSKDLSTCQLPYITPQLLSGWYSTLSPLTQSNIALPFEYSYDELQVSSYMDDEKLQDDGDR